MMTQEGAYWLFTASAQTVAAFVAFLLAGFALSLGMLDGAAQRDETLVEVTDALKRQYHGSIRFLSYLTGLAIVTNLAIVMIQGYAVPYHWSLPAVGMALNVVAIGLAIHFTVGLVDPDRVQKAARRLLAARPAPPAPVPTTNVADFLAAFIPVERKLRDVAYAAEMLADRSEEQRFVSFSRLVQLLAARRLITPGVAERLSALARYRNLVVHGHVESVEQEMVDEAKKVFAMLEESFPARG